ncbi:MAG: hypothetical protein KDD37_04830, partial [Bdellovibrionales bacterium]|nr:hypothetical protein [Bdellovibrionales bacterium]
MRFAALVFFFSVLLSNMSCKKDVAKNEPPESSNTNNSSATINPNVTPALEESKFLNTTAGIEWQKIWKETDQVKALNAFKEKYGLPLEGSIYAGELSFESIETPCGTLYLNFVKTTEDVTTLLKEIDANGKVLREWHVGTLDFLRIEKNSIYRIVSFKEMPDLSDTKSHSFVLKINSDKSFEVLDYNEASTKEWVAKTIDCPKNIAEPGIFCRQDI